MSTLTTIGFGNVAANTDLEKIFSVVTMFSGAFMYATIFGKVTSVISQFSSANGRYTEMINNIGEFMKLHDMPKQLYERVMDYVISTWSITKGIDRGKVI